MRQAARMVMGLVVLGVVMAAQLEARETVRRKRRIIVCIPERKLALLEDDQILKIFSVAVGAPISPSPAGEFSIVQRLDQPAYYKHGKVIPPGKENPLGTRWLGLSLKGYGIHGTNAPKSIGKARSHGCIRMRNQDIEELFPMVAVGDIVELHNEYSDRIARILGIKNPQPDSHTQTMAVLLSQPISSANQKSAGL